jgi:hypothetical protein
MSRKRKDMSVTSTEMTDTKALKILIRAQERITGILGVNQNQTTRVKRFLQTENSSDEAFVELLQIGIFGRDTMRTSIIPRTCSGTLFRRASAQK